MLERKSSPKLKYMKWCSVTLKTWSKLVNQAGAVQNGVGLDWFLGCVQLIWSLRFSWIPSIWGISCSCCSIFLLNGLFFVIFFWCHLFYFHIHGSRWSFDGFVCFFLGCEGRFLCVWLSCGSRIGLCMGNVWFVRTSFVGPLWIGCWWVKMNI